MFLNFLVILSYTLHVRHFRFTSGIMSVTAAQHDTFRCARNSST